MSKNRITATAKLDIFDSNADYWISFSDCEHGPELNKSLCIGIINTDHCKEYMNVPEETEVIISEVDARYLYYWLKVYLKDK